jgi:hypothetical protein
MEYYIETSIFPIKCIPITVICESLRTRTENSDRHILDKQSFVIIKTKEITAVLQKLERVNIKLI